MPGRRWIRNGHGGPFLSASARRRRAASQALRSPRTSRPDVSRLSPLRSHSKQLGSERMNTRPSSIPNKTFRSKSHQQPMSMGATRMRILVGTNTWKRPHWTACTNNFTPRHRQQIPTGVIISTLPTGTGILLTARATCSPRCWVAIRTPRWTTSADLPGPCHISSRRPSMKEASTAAGLAAAPKPAVASSRRTSGLWTRGTRTRTRAGMTTRGAAVQREKLWTFSGGEGKPGAARSAELGFNGQVHGLKQSCPGACRSPAHTPLSTVGTAHTMVMAGWALDGWNGAVFEARWYLDDD